MDEPAPPTKATAAPRPPPKRKRTEQPQPKEQAAQAASVAANKARSQDPLQNRNVAPPSAAGRGSSLSPAKWQSRLLAHIERRKPRANGEYGTAAIAFTIDDAGNVVSGAATALRSPAIPDYRN
jgi:protein TonB